MPATLQRLVSLAGSSSSSGTTKQRCPYTRKGEIKIDQAQGSKRSVMGASQQQRTDWKPFVYGGLASIVAELGTFPLDTTKTRLQVQGQKFDRRYSNLKYSGMTDALLQISQQEGFKALYSGISSAILRQATYGTIKFGTYYSLKKAAMDRWETDDLVVINIVCAAVAGAISSAIANPTDVVKVRMQVTGSSSNLSLFGCFQDVYRHEGIRGLWRGVGPTAQRAAIIAAVELPIYDYSKKNLTGLLGDSVSNHFVLFHIDTQTLCCVRARAVE